MKGKIKGIILILSICIMIVFYGFIVISGDLPKFIKDRSGFKINYSISPFDFRMDINEYSLYINSKVVDNMKNGSIKLVNDIENKVHNNASGIINKTSEAFKGMEEKINSALHNKVK
ncbi:hypothetical protein [Clostridium thailandense]|nr:hypothetical protein [Clostridium thailandense]